MRLPVNHPQLGQLHYTATPIREDPDGQVADTISLMRRYVLEDAGSLEVRQALSEATGADPLERVFGWVQQGFPEGEPLDRVFRWVKSRLRFVNDEELAAPWKDPNIVEVLIRPRDMYTLHGRRQGDCDDYVMMAAAMLTAEGIPVHFVTVAAEADDPGRFSHVYLAAYVDGTRVPVDVSHGPHVGWEVPPESVYRIQEWPLRESNSIWLLAVLLGALYAGRRYVGLA